jgi:hypothetical protein
MRRRIRASPVASRLAVLLWPTRVHFRCRLSGSIRCSPPRLAATQLLQVLTRNTVPNGRGLPPRRIVTLHSALAPLCEGGRAERQSLKISNPGGNDVLRLPGHRPGLQDGTKTVSFPEGRFGSPGRYDAKKAAAGCAAAFVRVGSEGPSVLRISGIFERNRRRRWSCTRSPRASCQDQRHLLPRAIAHVHHWRRSRSRLLGAARNGHEGHGEGEDSVFHRMKCGVCVLY